MRVYMAVASAVSHSTLVNLPEHTISPVSLPAFSVVTCVVVHTLQHTMHHTLVILARQFSYAKNVMKAVYPRRGCVPARYRQ